MKNEFKAGDLVFEVSLSLGIKLTVLTAYANSTYPIKGSRGRYTVYTVNGHSNDNEKGVPSLLLATPENRQALVTLYGEDAVPKLPLRGSELTKRLLDKQKYGLCYVSDTNDGDCRENKRVSVIERFEDGYFYTDKVNGLFVCTWKYAVPVDNNGNEITEFE